MKPFAFLAVLTLLVVQPAFSATQAADSGDEGEWQVLFDGTSLEDWKPTEENPDSFKLEDGKLVVHGPRAHLFYNGPVMDHNFKDFELQLEAMTTKGSNSGVFFHCVWQPEDWPNTGYEAQVNTSQGDIQKTGGIYDVIKVTEAPSKDNEWFTYNIIIKGKTITLKVDGKTTAEYDEKDKAELDRRSRGSDLSSGTIAIQAHDPNSKVYYRNIKIRPLD